MGGWEVLTWSGIVATSTCLAGNARKIDVVNISKHANRVPPPLCVLQSQICNLQSAISSECPGGGRFGTLISIEGRYWQSSAARTPTRGSWKNDPALGGRFDVLLDLATHWADLVTHIYGRLPDRTSVRRSFVNAAAAHRDTHVHLTMEFGDLVSFGSVSKTVHGAENTLELEILGERASASWAFEDRLERRVSGRARVGKGE